MSFKQRKSGSKRGPLWRVATALGSAVALTIGMAALAPAANATGGGSQEPPGPYTYYCQEQGQPGSGNYHSNPISGLGDGHYKQGHENIIPPTQSKPSGRNWDATHWQIWRDNCGNGWPTPETASVTVNKVWKINGKVVSVGEAGDWGLSATPTIASKSKQHGSYGSAEEKAWGTAYSYDKDTYLSLNEIVINSGSCTIDNRNSTDLPLEFKLKEDVTKTITNAYTCPPTVTVNKVWKINGKVVSVGEAGDWGLSATLTIASKSKQRGSYGSAEEKAWGTAYSYDKDTYLSLNEIVINSGSCTIHKRKSTDLPLEIKLTSSTVRTITNAYNCEQPDEPPTTVTVVKQWVVNGGEPVADSDDDGMTPGELSVGSVEAPDWGVAITLTGESLAWPEITEGNATISKELCSVTAEPTVSHDNELVIGENNIITVTNYVTCRTNNGGGSNIPTPTELSPGYTAECAVVDGADQVTVTPTVVTGIGYEVTDNGTAAVTVVASLTGSNTVWLAPEGWDNAGGALRTVVTSEGLDCAETEVAGVSQEVTSKPTKPTVQVKGESQVEAAPSATAKTGETSSYGWAGLALAAGLLLLLGAARLRRENEAG